MTMDLEQRRIATEATMAKYRDRTLDFKTADCIRMVRYHLLQRGHKPPPLPQYRSLIGARRALDKAGGMAAIFDGLLPRIAPARMLLGDICIVPGDGGDAAMICVGYKFWGWHQDHDGPVNNVIDLNNIGGAWRA